MHCNTHINYTALFAVEGDFFQKIIILIPVYSKGGTLAHPRMAYMKSCMNWNMALIPILWQTFIRYGWSGGVIILMYVPGR